MSTTIGDDTTPVYRFEFENRTVRSDEVQVEEHEDYPWDRTPFDPDEGLDTTSVEVLAQYARQDPECEVTLVGFE